MREAYARFEGMGETPSKEKRTSASVSSRSVLCSSISTYTVEHTFYSVGRWWRAVGYYSGLER